MTTYLNKQIHIPILLLNFIGFELVWFALVTQGDKMAWLGFLFAAVHLTYFRQSKTETKFVFLIAILGTLLDSFLTSVGLFQFSQNYTQNLAPLWLMSLWFAFACTVNHSLSFLRKSRTLQIIFAALFAPVSYFAGYQFEAVNFGTSTLVALCLLALIWAAFLPFCFWLNRQLSEQAHA